MTGTALVLALSFLAAACSADANGDNGAAVGDVYRVEIESCAGPDIQRATAMAVSTELVATAAHTFDGARDVILRTDVGDEVDADVIYADFDKDIALLTVAVTNTRVFRLGQPEVETKIRFHTYADVEGIRIKEGSIVRKVDATLDGAGRRAALELAAEVERGDSGAPVVDESNDVVGMVFATSRVDERGWAIAAVEIQRALDEAEALEDPEPLSFCRGDG